MTKMRSVWDDVETHHFPCDCGDQHYVEVFIEGEWKYLWVGNVYRPTALRKRIVAAWKVLRGKGFHQGEIVLNQLNMSDLRDVLVKALEEDVAYWRDVQNDPEAQQALKDVGLA